MGHEPLTKYVVSGVVLLQLTIAYLLRHTAPVSPIFLFCAYIIGGTANHNLFLAIHEITHNLAFKGVQANKALAVFANLPIGIPYSAAFKVPSLISLAPTSILTDFQRLLRDIILSTTSTWAKMVSIPTYPRAWSLYVSAMSSGKCSLRKLYTHFKTCHYQ